LIARNGGVGIAARTVHYFGDSEELYDSTDRPGLPRTIKFLEPKGYIVVLRPLEVGKFLSLKV